MDAETFEKKMTNALHKLTPEDIKHIKSKFRCEYCQPNKKGKLKSLTDFRISEGKKVTFSLNVKSFDGGGTSLEDAPRLYPYGSLSKFKYCPMCGRLLDGSEN